MNNVTFRQERTCLNCYYEKVEKLKASSEICTKCFADDTPEKRYPQWKQVEK